MSLVINAKCGSSNARCARVSVCGLGKEGKGGQGELATLSFFSLFFFLFSDDCVSLADGFLNLSLSNTA
jgi:hypothetical protein